MITLHTAKEDKNDSELEGKLKDLVIAYRKTEHETNEESLPYIEEDGKLFRTAEEINAWLEEIRAELGWQRSMSGDGCYIDPNSGKTC